VPRGRRLAKFADRDDDAQPCVGGVISVNFDMVLSVLRRGTGALDGAPHYSRC
jgi:hypothetical protein